MTPSFARRIHDGIQRRRYQYFKKRNFNVDVRPGMVSFTFDDFPSSAANTGAELLESYGYRGTFYLSTGLLGTESIVGRLSTVDEVQALHLRGHEIGSHTHSHRRCQAIGKSELAQEQELCSRALERFGGGRNMALPFGAYDESALSFLSGKYDTIRTVQNGINRGLTDLNLLKANAVYEATAFDKLRGQVESVSETGGWLIFYTHDVCALPSEFGCTADYFKALLNLVNQADLPVRTVADAYRLLRSN